MQNGGRFCHFHHKGGFATGKIIRRPHAAKHAVAQAKRHGLRRHKGPHLRHNDHQGILPKIGAFARHVGTG